MGDKDEITFTETFEEYKNPLQDHVDKHLPGFSKLCVVKPHGAIMSYCFEDHHLGHLSYPCKATDIWVASYPKCGTTWTQELVWCLIRGFDHPNGKKPLMERFPFFEWDSMMTPELIEMMSNLPKDNPEKPGAQKKILEEQEEPRLIKTHLFKQLLPRGVDGMGSKIIYVVRDPKDVCVSLYYHTVKFLEYSGDFNDFVKVFLYDTYEFGPFWSNVLSYWEQRNSGQVLFIRYEELQKDLTGMIITIGKFLGVVPSNEKVSAMVKHLSFDSMKSNKATNNETIMIGLADTSKSKFMRKGIVGDYKNFLSKEQISEFKEWTEKWLKDSDFPYYRDS